ncbi:hypothetical protein RRG08_001556 [Elysia crispata]|uniref:Uncharacterized protein n=1 Tax=Elysia crispata TaxID=231223 RepID=A0AAE1E186_9GAST|nr:hypothetical protein RRG08_001556 [Elysia crispata]
MFLFSQDPILKRQNCGLSKRVIGAGRGNSTNSNVSCQSLDSGRESSVSVTSQASISSDDAEYITPSRSFEAEEISIRSTRESKRRESTKQNRISMKDMFLSLSEKSETEGEELPTPPPVPPRPPSRAARQHKNTKTRSLSQTTPPVTKPKPQVFVKRGTSNPQILPIPSPRNSQK